MTRGLPEEKYGEGIYATAAEYLLGLLQADELEAFRQQLANDDSLLPVVAKAAQNMCLLADCLSAAAPPPRLKARFLDSIRSEPPADSPRPTLGSIRTHEGKWRP